MSTNFLVPLVPVIPMLIVTVAGCAVLVNEALRRKNDRLPPFGFGLFALIGLAGAIGAEGGLLINLAFRQSFADAKSGVPAFVGFLIFYGLCFAVTWAVYLRKPAEQPTSERGLALAGAEV